MNIIEVGVFIAYLVGLLGVGLWYFIKMVVKKIISLVVVKWAHG